MAGPRQRVTWGIGTTDYRLPRQGKMPPGSQRGVLGARASCLHGVDLGPEPRGPPFVPHPSPYTTPGFVGPVNAFRVRKKAMSL